MCLGDRANKTNKSNMENTTTNSEELVKQPIFRGKVEKNGVSFEIYEYPFTKGVGAQLGNTYLHPKIEDLTIAKLTQFYGDEAVLDMFKVGFKKFNNEATKQALEDAALEGKDEDPNAVLDFYKGYLIDPEAQAITESKPELERQQKEVFAELTALAKRAAKDPTLFPQVAILLEKSGKLGEMIAKKSRAPRKAVAEEVEVAKAA